MSEDAQSWPVQTFMQANPEGEGQDDVAALLRRVADTLDKFERPNVMDLILHTEIEDGIDRPSIVVYLHHKPLQP